MLCWNFDFRGGGGKHIPKDRCFALEWLMDRVFQAIWRHLILICIAFASLIPIIRAANNSMETVDNFKPYTVTPTDRLIRPLYAIGFYIQKFICPTNLHFWYYLKGNE